MIKLNERVKTLPIVVFVEVMISVSLLVVKSCCQGDLKKLYNSSVFLTVYGVGSSYQSGEHCMKISEILGKGGRQISEL